MSIIATLLLMTAAVMAADKISIAPVTGITNIPVRWDAVSNPIVLGYWINCNGVRHQVPGITNTILTFSNLSTPGMYEFTAQTYSSKTNSVESPSVSWYQPLTLLRLSYPTNCIFQQSLSVLGPWTNCQSIVTNNGSRCFFRAKI